jgi:HSP20 family protein
MHELARDIDRVLNLSLNGVSEPAENLIAALQIWEDDQSYTVKALLPGADRESLGIEVSPNRVVLSGKMNFVPPADAYLRHSEFKDMEFRRSLKLTHAVQTTGVVADYAQGVLTLTLPKAEPARVVKVKVQGSETSATSVG